MTRHDWSEWVGELEQRGFSRVRCDIKTHCRLVDSAEDSSPFQGQTCDVSGGGLQLRFPADHEVQRGQSVELYFRNKAEDIDFTLMGVVVWRRRSDETGDFAVGIQFPELPPAHREALLGILRRDQEDEEAEEGETHLLRLKRYLSARVRYPRWIFPNEQVGLVRDIGFGGMGVEAKKRWRSNALCSARVFIETEAEPVDILARVVRSERDGRFRRWITGLRFEAMDEDSRHALRRFLVDEIRRAIMG